MRPAYPVAYDPSAPYRGMMMPHVQPPSMGYPYAQPPPVMMPDYAVPPPPPATMQNRDNNGGVVSRIPQYFYPRFDDSPYVEPSPPMVDPYSPYGQPVPLGSNPYGPDPNYPYGAPYLVPLADNVHVNPSQPPLLPMTQEPARPDILERHKTDADLSRLEVYHFAPKNAPPASSSGQPIIQYHVYPPSNSSSVPPPPQAVAPPPLTNANPYPWYGHPSEMPQSYPPAVEMRPRGIQTDAPEMKNRGVSPMHLPETAVHDSRTYGRAPLLSNHLDQYEVVRPTKFKSKHYESHHEPPLADCRCLECRQRREKVLNYYAD